MNNLTLFLKILLSDEFVFIALQLVLLCIVLYASLIGRKRIKKHNASRVFRVKYVFLSYSLLSASVVQAVSSVDLFADSKLILIIANLAATFYLCFFNSWFRLILERVVLRSEQIA